MQKKLISGLLVFTVALFTVAPPRVLSQTRTRAATSLSEQIPDVPPAKTKAELRKSLATAFADTKAGPLTEADLKRIEQQQDDTQTNNQPKPGWSRKKKLLVALLVVVAVGAFVVAYKHRCKDTPEKKCPEIDTTDDSF